MEIDAATASLLGGMIGPFLACVLVGVPVLVGLFCLVGAAVLADLNQTIRAVHQRDTPAR